MLTAYDDRVAALVRAGVPRHKAEASARAEFGSPETPATTARDATIAEKREQHEIVKRLRAFGFRVWSTSQPRRAKVTPGLPDLIALHERAPICLFWEVKRQVGGRFSAEQFDFARLAAQSGAHHGAGDRYALEAQLEALGLAVRTAGGLEPVHYTQPTVP